jgi:hypothetical protein
MDVKKRFIDFVEVAKGLDPRARMRLLLFASGAKPATFVPFKITPKTLSEKNYLRIHLLETATHYSASTAKSFEEITSITKTKINWDLIGIWYGYDLFNTKTGHALFKKYASLHKRGRHKEAARVAAKIYNYPSCCVAQYIKEQDPKYLRKNYTAYQFMSRRQKLQHKFPFLSFTPCSSTCSRAKALNQKYGRALKTHSPRFYADFTRKKTVLNTIIIDGETDLYLSDTEPVWLEKDGHEYEVVAKKKIGGKYYLFTHLQKKSLEKGVVATARITMQHALATINITKITGFSPGVTHTRHFAILPV